MPSGDQLNSLPSIAAIALLALSTEAEVSSLGSRAVAGASDYEVLKEARVFRAGPVGYAGVTSQEEGALHSVLLRSDADRQLRRLASEASVPGRLYALWGLAVLADAEFDRLSAALASDNSTVRTQRGCVIRSEALPEIVERIQSGEYGEPRAVGEAAGQRGPASRRSTVSGRGRAR